MIVKRRMDKDIKNNNILVYVVIVFYRTRRMGEERKGVNVQKRRKRDRKIK
jgi:hypothetical protein